MLSNQELLNGLAFFCVPFALLYLERYFVGEGRWKLLVATLFLSGCFYFSYYHFLFGFALFSGLFLLRYFQTRRWEGRFEFLVLTVFVLTTLPNFIRLFSPELSEAYNPLESISDGPSRFSLSLASFLSALPQNLIYPDRISAMHHLAMKMDYKANLGMVCWGLAVIGMFTGAKVRCPYLFIFVLFTLVSLGPEIRVAGRSFSMPLNAFYQLDIFERFFRIPGRAFVVANFALAVLAARGFMVLRKRVKRANLLAVCLLVVFFLENLPLRVHPEDHSDVFAMPEIYELIQADEPQVIAELPSSLFTDAGYVRGISEFSREYRYQYWQTRHHHHILNGSVSYFPRVRMENNALLIKVAEGDNLPDLIRWNTVDYVTFHKDLIMSESEAAIYPYLNSRNYLRVLLDTDRVVLYQVVPEKLNEG